MRNKYPVINDRKSFGYMVNSCNGNIPDYLILNHWRIYMITFVSKTPAFLKMDRGFNEWL